MLEAFSDETLELMKRFKSLFDPQCRLNPGKLLPTGKGCLEIRQKPELVL
jgi:glycolate oxidase